ncbi:NUDIX domain-containing protein [Candidatus Pacearchaeota archaeon]|jgi:8-oxo-dGTP pyrophosphatase MutT (NUDIX family)|nr:NUDIX domain-containing protein [Candidatus Pacearchaeota archaeon]
MRKGKLRHAIFAVAYSVNENNKIKYLILKRKKHWVGWEFPKGKIEFLETKKMTVRREIKEETGLKILKIKKFNVDGLYKYKKKMNDRKGFIGQTYHLFSAEVQMGKVSIDKREHSDFKWMNFNEAVKKVTWENQKKCLKIVNEWVLLKKEPNIVENLRKPNKI